MASDNHTVVFYGLSTCIHCKHCREFLEKHAVPFELHYVDLAEGSEREEMLQTVREYNPQLSFPTVVIDGSRVIVGFQPEAMTEALDL